MGPQTTHMQLIILATFILQTAYAATVQEKIEGAFFGSLVADALTLGSHYEYDAPTIKKAYGGTISEYMHLGNRWEAPPTGSAGDAATTTQARRKEIRLTT